MPDTAHAKSADALCIGVLGVGRAGWGMISQEVKDRPDIRIAAGCDIIKDRPQKLAAAFGATPYTNRKKFLQDPNVELVVVATRSRDHAAMSIEALKAGKHVLVEKPMALNAKQADKMIAAAKESGRTLLVRHNRRFDAPFLQAKEIVASGKLGPIFLIRLRQHGYQRRNDWQTLKEFGGGQLFNWGPHLVDWGMRLLGSPAKDVWSDLKRVAAVGDAEDQVKILIRGENGVVVDIEISGGVAIGQPNWQLCGTHGAAVIHGNECHLRYLDRTGMQEITADPETPKDGASFGNAEKLTWIEEKFPVAPKQTFEFWQEVHKAIKQGTPFPVTLEEARDNLRVIDLARKGTGF
jgi:predicted dehydrogenase